MPALLLTVPLVFVIAAVLLGVASRLEASYFGAEPEPVGAGATAGLDTAPAGLAAAA